MNAICSTMAGLGIGGGIYFLTDNPNAAALLGWGIAAAVGGIIYVIENK